MFRTFRGLNFKHLAAVIYYYYYYFFTLVSYTDILHFSELVFIERKYSERRIRSDFCTSEYYGYLNTDKTCCNFKCYLYCSPWKIIPEYFTAPEIVGSLPISTRAKPGGSLGCCWFGCRGVMPWRSHFHPVSVMWKLLVSQCWTAFPGTACLLLQTAFCWGSSLL